VENIKEQLIRHEGLRLTVYDCPAGYKTIGVGRNLEEKGITKEEAMHLLNNDIKEFESSLVNSFSWFSDLDEARRNALINMAFNLGMGGIKKFRKMISAIEEKNWTEASEQMLDSKWAKQVGRRAIELSDMMRHGNKLDREN
jgi:lysozyme|tara:strand:- start:216 stop:641 length:426 start_codon:yes stop_codon:yes gene_type:complete